MFSKYATNILQELSNDCLLKSFACKDPDGAKIYKGISDRAEQVIAKLKVEEMDKKASKTHG